MRGEGRPTQTTPVSILLPPTAFATLSVTNTVSVCVCVCVFIIKVYYKNTTTGDEKGEGAKMDEIDRAN